MVADAIRHSPAAVVQMRLRGAPRMRPPGQERDRERRSGFAGLLAGPARRPLHFPPRRTKSVAVVGRADGGARKEECERSGHPHGARVAAVTLTSLDCGRVRFVYSVRVTLTPVIVHKPDFELWFVTGSQHLYGPDTLARVARDSRAIVDG